MRKRTARRKAARAVRKAAARAVRNAPQGVRDNAAAHVAMAVGEVKGARSEGQGVMGNQESANGEDISSGSLQSMAVIDPVGRARFRLRADCTMDIGALKNFRAGLEAVLAGMEEGEAVYVRTLLMGQERAQAQQAGIGALRAKLEGQRAEERAEAVRESAAKVNNGEIQ